MDRGVWQWLLQGSVRKGGRASEMRCRSEMPQRLKRTLDCVQERDAAFYMDVGMTKDKTWITVSVNSKTTSEVHLIDSRDPWSPPRIIQPRCKS